MNIVSLDGAMGNFSCAVSARGTVLAHQVAPANVALEQGLPLLLDTLRLAALVPAEIDLLAVGIGPGAFTGLRIAISYAKSLALGWRRPLVGVSSFDALELGVNAVPRLGVISARAGISSVRLTHSGGEHRFSGNTAQVCDQVAPLAAGSSLSILGAPEDVLSGLGERGILVQRLAPSLPPAVAIAQLAGAREHAASIHAVRAEYGELPAAQVPKLR